MNNTQTAEAFRSWITSDRAFADHGRQVDNQPMLDTKRGAMIAHLEELCGGEKPRRSFLKYVFGVDSSADLTCRAQNALYLWLAPKPEEPGSKHWVVTNPRARNTAMAVLAAALIAAGQQELPI